MIITFTISCRSINAEQNVIPRAVITDSDNNVVNEPEVMSRVIEILDSDLAIEEKRRNIQEIVDETKLHIVILDTDY